MLNSSIVETAVRLCQSTYGHVRLLRDDGAYHIASHRISDPELLALMLDNPFHPGVDFLSGRAALEGVPVHVPDVAADPLISGFQRKISDKVRTALAVPLKRNGAVVGLISVLQNEVRPFTQRQIDLVTTFANQAVIAMNNVRLFEEVQARTYELTEALEYQTATSSVLNVIGRSPHDLQPVLVAITETAGRLCSSDYTGLL
jgi:GAF domain-containing protein